jgi:nucleotidyltransferase substrate binding protein (TIGR01987 family)
MYAESRWLQRFQNFQRALYHLDAAIAKGLENMNPLEVQSFIKGFELAYELAWKTLQDYLYDIGYEQIRGPKPVIQQAFQDGLLNDGNAWLEMHDSRNDAAHIYDEMIALGIARKIQASYYRSER